MNPSVKSKGFYKLHQITEVLNNFKQKNIPVSFVAIVETWLKDYITDAQLNICHYNVYRSDRSKSKNGGALLYIHESIIIDIFDSFDDDTCNAVICLSSKSNAIICCIYRPPSAGQNSFINMLNFISRFIDTHNKSDKLKTFLFGDFNFPDIHWKNDQITEYIRSPLCH